MEPGAGAGRSTAPPANGTRQHHESAEESERRLQTEADGTTSRYMHATLWVASLACGERIPTSRGVLRPSDEFTNEGKPIRTVISKTATSCPDTWRFFELGDGHAAPDRRGPRVRARARGGAAGRGRGPARRKTYHSERAGGAARAVPEARGEAATGARLSFLRATRGVTISAL